MVTHSLLALLLGLAEEQIAIGAPYSDAMEQLRVIVADHVKRRKAVDKLQWLERNKRLAVRDLLVKSLRSTAPIEERRGALKLLQLEHNDIVVGIDILTFGPEMMDLETHLPLLVGWESVREALSLGEFAKPMEVPRDA